MPSKFSTKKSVRFFFSLVIREKPVNIRLCFNRIIWNIVNDFYSFQEINCISWDIPQSYPLKPKSSSRSHWSFLSKAELQREKGHNSVLLETEERGLGTTWTAQAVSKACSQIYSISRRKQNTSAYLLKTISFDKHSQGLDKKCPYSLAVLFLQHPTKVDARRHELSSEFLSCMTMGQSFY